MTKVRLHCTCTLTSKYNLRLNILLVAKSYIQSGWTIANLFDEHQGQNDCQDRYHVKGANQKGLNVGKNFRCPTKQLVKQKSTAGLRFDFLQGAASHLTGASLVFVELTATTRRNAVYHTVGEHFEIRIWINATASVLKSLELVKKLRL